MKGFRKISGVNWLTDQSQIRINDAGMPTMTYTNTGKLPLHWQRVKQILLNNL